MGGHFALLFMHSGIISGYISVTFQHSIVITQCRISIYYSNLNCALQKHESASLADSLERNSEKPSTQLQKL